MNNNTLTNLRNVIDKIDDELVRLLAKRTEIVKQIGEYKNIHQLPPLDRKRWKVILRSKIKLAKKLNLNTVLIKKIYEIIHLYSLKSQTFQKIIIFGIQGGKGSFNEQAILEYTDRNKIKKYKIKYLYTSEKVLKNLNIGNIDYGLFAITNSTGGIVEESIQALAKYQCEIVSDFQILIRHVLMKRKDVNTSEIDTIMAHPQVFAQCQVTLKNNYSKYKLKSGEGDLIDTAKAGKSLSSGKLPKNIAILGSTALSKLYEFDIIAENLQDKNDNFTRFLLIKR